MLGSDPTPLTVNLNRAANPTVLEVPCDVFTPGISPGAAPGAAEPPCLGAGVVDHALEITRKEKEIGLNQPSASDKELSVLPGR